jgi:xanthosine phosphorylase
MQGRIHIYEGVDPRAIAVPVRALKLAGCEGLVITNAAGSMRAGMGPGSLMAVSDHMNFQGTSPLVGPNEDRFGPRFFAMKDAYDPGWRARMKQAAGRLGIALAEGVYTGYLGPNFETPAEIRAFARLGGDAVGMSTVAEVLVARHCGLKVAALCVITNMAAGMSDEDLTPAQPLAGAAAAAESLERLLLAFLEDLT